MADREDSGGGKGEKRNTQFYGVDPQSTDLAVLAKKSMVSIPRTEGEYLCAARAMVTCVSKLRDSPQRFANICNKRNANSSRRDSQRGLAIAMHMATGVSAEEPVPIRLLHKFEKYLDVCCVVYSGDYDDVIYVGTHTDKEKVFLYLKDFHYDSITNMNGFLPKYSHWCDNCMKIHTAKNKCQYTCRACRSKDCNFVSSNDNNKDDGSKTWIQCRDCNVMCRDQDCYDRHKQDRVYKTGVRKGEHRESLCQTFYNCPKCNKVVDCTKRDISEHSCQEYFCRCCSQWAPDRDHLCYYRIKKGRNISAPFIFYDIEAMQITKGCSNYTPTAVEGCKQCTTSMLCPRCRKCLSCDSALCQLEQHVANFIVCQSVCDKCKKDNFTPDSTCLECGDRCEHHRKMALKTKYKDDVEIGKCTKCTFKREKVFKGENAMDDFCKWLIHPVNAERTTMAHNGGKYDNILVLNWLINHGYYPEITFNGGKLVLMTVRNSINLRFMDTLAFFGLPLRSLPEAFGLEEELRKGMFPYGFNTPENQDYCGPIPPMCFYYPETMKPTQRDEFLKFYKEAVDNQYLFDFQAEILAYTREDVNIIRKCTMHFRDVFKEITTLDTEIFEGHFEKVEGSDCFSSVTLASSAMQFVRQQLLKEHHEVVLKDGRHGSATLKRGQWVFEGEEFITQGDIETSRFIKSDIAQVPARGYTKCFRDSSVACKWLDWMAHKNGRPLQHARNGAEFKVPGTKYRVDGYDPVTKEIYEFLGCEWHFCLKCSKDPKARDLRTGKTVQQLNRDTMNRINEIRRLGFVVHTQWECGFARECKNNPALKAFLSDYIPPPPRLKIRDALFGGRTGPFKLYYKAQPGWTIQHFDVKSMYPYVLISKPYANSHPSKIIIDQSEMDYTMQSHEGIASVTILPPRALYIPILPLR